MSIFFSLHGIPIAVDTELGDLQQLILRHLSPFHQSTQVGSPRISIHLTKVDAGKSLSSKIPSEAQLVFSTKEPVQKVSGLTNARKSAWTFDLYQHKTQLLGYFPGFGLFHLDGPVGKGEAFLRRPERRSEESLTYFFHLMLTELLRWQQLYTIHAAALAFEGQGILISGHSGRGKTSSCLALVRQGYRFLSDDHPLARLTPQGVEVLAWPVKIDVTDTTVGFFPELKNSAKALGQGKKKKYFCIEEFYPDSPIDSCVPKFLFFPTVVQEPKCRVVALSKRQAMEYLLPQALTITHKNLAKENIAVLSRLVEQVACYQLLLGQDLLSLPELITPLVRK